MAVVGYGSNIDSLRIQRRLNKNSTQLNDGLSRLSTGLRINKASDDAAGLAVASKLRSDNKVYAQGVRNVNDAISLLNTSQGAVENLSSILTRLKELAEQSSNGVLSLTQRKSLHAEGTQLVQEYNRIVESTEFNNQVLIDGDLNRVSIQAGFGQAAAISFELGEELARAQGGGTFSLASTLGGGSGDQQSKLIDVNNDGKLDLISTSATDTNFNVQLGNGDGTFQTLTAYDAGGLNGAGPLAVADFNGDGNLDVLVLRAGTLTNQASEAAISFGNGDGTFQAATAFSARAGSTNYNNEEIAVGDIDNDGDLDFGFSGSTALTGGQYFQIALNNGNGTFTVGSAPPGGGVFTSGSIQFGDLNADGNLDVVTGYGDSSDLVTIALGNGTGTFTTYASYAGGDEPGRSLRLADFNQDGVLDIVNANSTGISVRLGVGDGTFGTNTDYTAGVVEVRVADVNGDGLADIVGGSSGTITTLLGNGDGTFQSAQTSTGGVTASQIELGDLNGDGVLESVMTGNNNLYISSQQTTETNRIPYLDLLTTANSTAALSTIDTLMTRVHNEIAQIGSSQSRLASASRVLFNLRDQTAAAESRISDIDYAVEVTEVVRKQILQDTGTALLAHANLTPQIALQVLRGE